MPSRITPEVEPFRRLLAYDRQVFGQFRRAVERRGWAEAARDRGIGHGSLKNTLTHVLNVHEAWTVAIAQERWEIFERPGRQPQEISSFAGLRRYEAQVWAGQDVLIDALTGARLASRVKAPWMPGRYDLGEAIVQVTLEQAHHLGEIIGVFWQNDWRPPSTTFLENRPWAGRPSQA